MKNNNVFAKFLLLTASTASLLGMASCASNDKSNKPVEPPVGDTFTPFEVTDTLGRKVNITKKPQKVLCIGASALRLYSYVGNMDLLCGVEAWEVMDKNPMPIRPYSYAYGEKFKTLKPVATGGPMKPANAEAIIAANPDVVFSLYNDVAKMDGLSKAINKPIVCLSYGKSDPFSNDVHKSIELIGKVIGEEARATELSTAIKGWQKDLNDRTKNIPAEQKPSVYLGYNQFQGKPGTLGSTMLNFTCFKETNANNVVSSIQNLPNNNTLEIETVLRLNPQMMFIDSANYGKFVADYKDPTMRATLDKLDAVKNNKVHVIMPFNQYYTNIDIAIADSYAVGKAMFPEAFKDVDVTAKYNEILTSMLRVQKDYYAMTTAHTKVGFGAIDLSKIQ